RELSLSAPYYSQIEKGSRRLSSCHLVQIAEILVVYLGELSGMFSGLPDLVEDIQTFPSEHNAKVNKQAMKLCDEVSPKNLGEYTSFFARRREWSIRLFDPFLMESEAAILSKDCGFNFYE
ncbi:MAG: helix-turn-helix transcriptional regulator, partial [Candidatus Latescibacterota bacterium]|nr:helix-turn-helix transcriptional regulator [Candidatus Latescibacterota bacterium]